MQSDYICPSARRLCVPMGLAAVVCSGFILIAFGTLPNMEDFIRNSTNFATDQLKNMIVLTEPENLNPDNISDASDDDIAKFEAYVFNQTLNDWIGTCLDIFIEIADDLGMVWWITSGTLLGSYRHHNKIPWDGDIDVLAPVAMKDKFRKTFKERKKNGSYAGYDLNWSLPWDKLYSINNIKNNQRWGSPFVDIFWYDVNGTKVSARSYSTMTWKQILPLSFRPLGKRTVPAPYDPVDYLNRLYGSNWRKDCSSGSYDYLHEHAKPKKFRVTMKCATLLNAFPFVRHIQGPADMYCKEELVFKGRVLSTHVRSANNIPVC